MYRLFAASAFTWILWTMSALSAELGVQIPDAIAAFAQKLDGECRDNRWGHVVANENYTDAHRDIEDVNADGLRDYFVYKCMFGCSEKPFAFTGQLTPCPWGVLLLSHPTGYSEVFVPGMINRIRLGSSLLVSIRRPRALRLIGNFCKGPFATYDPEYAYELKDNRFVLLGMCPVEGGKDCLSAIRREPGI